MAEIEKKVAQTILQEKQRIKVAGIEYEVSQPSIATLIKVSSITSTIPHLDINKEQILEQAIAFAPDCGRQIAEIVATLVLGVHKEADAPFFAFLGRIQRLFPWGRKTMQERLVDSLLHDVTPKEISNLVIRLLSMMQIEDFFGVTISLNEINLTRPTKEMVTTQPGQSLQEQQRDSD